MIGVRFFLRLGCTGTYSELGAVCRCQHRYIGTDNILLQSVPNCSPAVDRWPINTESDVHRGTYTRCTGLTLVCTSHLPAPWHLDGQCNHRPRRHRLHLPYRHPLSLRRLQQTRHNAFQYKSSSTSIFFQENSQETQLSLTNRATHLCKCNGVVDLLT